MFTLNDDLSIYATRGDIVFFSVSAEQDGKPYKFQAGDVVRIKIFGKKDAETVLLQKDFPVLDVTEKVEIFLSEADTKIGEVISKPKDYWYEVELNPGDDPQTIIGYDEDGAKVFRLFPEGDDIPEYVPSEEEVGAVDTELDMTSNRAVANSAVAKAFANLEAGYKAVHAAVAEKFVTPQMFGAVGDGETDDTEAIQAAINSNSRVVVPSGKYLVTAPLYLGNGHIIEGRGAELLYDGDGYLFNISSNYTDKAQIIGLQIHGNGENGFVKCDNNGQWGSSFIVEGCYVTGFGGNSVVLVGGYSVVIRGTVICHTSATPCIVATAFSNVVSIENTVFLGDENKAAVFIDTTNIVCLACEATTFELGNTAVIGIYPAHFKNCWFEQLALVTTNAKSTFIGCNVASCDKCVDGGDGVSLQPVLHTSSIPKIDEMTVSNPIAEMMDKDEFAIDRRIAEGTYNGTYYSQEITKLTNKKMCYNVPLNMLTASGTPNSAGAFFMYQAPPFASSATYKLTLIGITHFADGAEQVTHANAILKSGVYMEYNKIDNHVDGNYAGAFGYSNGAFYYKNVSGNIKSMDIMVEFNLVSYS